MREDSLVEYKNPGIALPVADLLSEVLRNGARELLQQAVEAEVAEFIERHLELKDERERQRVVRNGYRLERTIQTGIGEVAVKAPRARDREGEIKFRYLWRNQSREWRNRPFRKRVCFVIVLCNNIWPSEAMEKGPSSRANPL